MCAVNAGTYNDYYNYCSWIILQLETKIYLNSSDHSGSCPIYCLIIQRTRSYVYLPNSRSQLAYYQLVVDYRIKSYYREILAFRTIKILKCVNIVLILFTAEKQSCNGTCLAFARRKVKTANSPNSMLVIGTAMGWHYNSLSLRIFQNPIDTFWATWWREIILQSYFRDYLKDF